MVTLEFSTHQADYWLQLGRHIGRNKHSSLPKLDALVVESGGKHPYNEKILKSDSQMVLPVSEAMENQSLIYNVDSTSSFLRSMGETILAYTAVAQASTFAFGFGAGLFIGGAPCLLWTEPKGFGKLADVWGVYTILAQDTTITLRDAIAARKLEESIAPELQENLGRKPRIGLVYGAGHSGLKHHLRHKWVRDFTLRNFRDFNFGKYRGIDRNTLDKITVFSPPNYNPRTYSSGLFD